LFRVIFVLDSMDEIK